MKAFISYNSRVRYFVDIIAKDLNDAGYETWYDKEITGSQEWWDEILNQIRKCDFFIFVVSTGSIISIACKREREYALNLNKRILYLRIGDLDHTILGADLNKQNIIAYDKQDKAQSLNLIKSIHRLPAAQSLPNPLPVSPAIPRSDLVELGDKIRQANLSADDQRLLFMKIKEYLKDQDDGDSAWSLLEELAEVKNIVPQVYDDIAELRPSQAFRKTLSHRKLMLEPRSFSHEGSADDVARFSPDSSKIITGGKDNVIRVWDALTAVVVKEYVGHFDTILDIVFGTDATVAFSVSMDGTIRQWGLVIGVENRIVLESPEAVVSAAFSTDGKVVAIGNNKGVEVFDIDKNIQVTLTGSKGNLIKNVAISADGSIAAYVTFTDSNKIILCNSVNGQQIGILDAKAKNVKKITFSPDGTRLAAALGDSNSIREWNISNQIVIKSYAINNMVMSLKYSHDSKMLAAGFIDNETHIVVWDVDNAKKVWSSNSKGTRRAEDLAFSADGTYIMACFYEAPTSLYTVINMSLT